MGIYQGSKLMSGGGGGPSPYEIAKQNGYTGTEQEFNQLLAALDQNVTEQDLNNKADKSVAFTVSLTAAGWVDNAQTISNANFLSAGYAYTVAPASGSFADYADAMVYADDVTADGQMVFHCDSAPTADLTVNIVRMVTAE